MNGWNKNAGRGSMKKDCASKKREEKKKRPKEQSMSDKGN